MEKDELVKWLAQMSELARAQGFEVTEWGEIQGLPLLGFYRGGEEKHARVYLSAGIHGDEPAGPVAIHRLFEASYFSSRLSWVICPLLNPRGYCTGSRNTPDGIDLNRDYRHSRSPEVTAHRKWLVQHCPIDLYLSLHEDWEVLGFYLYEINTSAFVPMGEVILREVAKVLPVERRTEIDDHRVASPGLIRHPPEPDEPENWPEAIFHCRTYPHLSYTFETPTTLPLEIRVEAHVVAVKTAVETFLEPANLSRKGGRE